MVHHHYLKNKISLLIFLVVYGTALPIFGQYAEEYIQQVQQGQYDQAKTALPQLIQQHPNDAGVLYLRALLETDGEKAYQYFKDLADNHRGSAYKDEAIMQVAEYLYAKGLYISAEKYLRRIPIHHPRSPHMERAVNMLINSMMQAGKVDSARTWKRVLARQFPGIDLNADVESRPSKVDEDSLTALAPPEPVDLSRENPYTEPADEGVQNAVKKTPEPVVQPPKKQFALQVGAFSTLQNAREQKDLFESYGYPVQIRERKRGNLQLYLVWIGSYDSREEAKRAGNSIEKRINLPFFIVETTQ